MWVVSEVSRDEIIGAPTYDNPLVQADYGWLLIFSHTHNFVNTLSPKLVPNNAI